MPRSAWGLITSPFARWLGTACIAVLGIYGTFYYERKPDLYFEILSSSKVLDIKESLTKLTISYDGTDLRATNQNLYLLVVRVVNKGSASIPKSSYDDAAPLGFTVNAGKILEVPKIVADYYLQNRLDATIRDDRTITFMPVILNAGDSFEVRTLLLVPEIQTLEVRPIGKIAGIKNIVVNSIYAESKAKSYYESAFGGSFLVQLARLLVYFIAVLLLGAAIGFVVVVPVSKVSDLVRRSKRSKKSDQYRRAVDRRLSLREEYLVTQYINQSLIYEIFSELIRSPQLQNEESIPSHPLYIARLNMSSSFSEQYQELEANGLIIRDGPQINIDPNFVEHAKEFINFVSPVPVNPVSRSSIASR